MSIESRKLLSHIDETVNCKVEIPGTEQFYIRSREKKREYRIFIAKPDVESPPSGYPVIYLLDANSVFGTMVEAVRIQSRKPRRTGVVPAVIVGVGYRGDTIFNIERHYDYTLSVPVSELPPSPDGKTWPQQGGANAFINFVESELKPMIESKIKIDRNRQTLFGHSLGGIFVLHMLFTKPDTFQTYVAGSPSIHWNKKPILEEEQKFLMSIKSKELSCNINIMIAVGELEKEQVIPMNYNARELSRRLSVYQNKGLRVQFHEFEGENHVSVLPVLINRALRFALSSVIP
ncbi:alpha/beta hydrolase [Clostridium kluyveri]|uniref:alpha/beta hydrolase n=1 Tax=Clostridium kluyveri TaxID=1534 RepID=UPI0009FAB4EA|nr:alpha/beta hydrolase [Clostridium kluyveri]